MAAQYRTLSQKLGKQPIALEKRQPRFFLQSESAVWLNPARALGEENAFVSPAHQTNHIHPPRPSRTLWHPVHTVPQRGTDQVDGYGRRRYERRAQVLPVRLLWSLYHTQYW